METIPLKKNKKEKNNEDENENETDFLIINTYRYNKFIKLVEFKIQEHSKLEKLKQIDDYFKEIKVGITVEFIEDRRIIEKMIPFFKNYKHTIIDVFSQDIYSDEKIFKSKFKTIVAASLDLTARYKCFLHETVFLLSDISIGDKEKFENILRCRKVIAKYENFFQELKGNIQSNELRQTYYTYKNCCLNVLRLNKDFILKKSNNDKELKEEENKFMKDILLEIKDLVG